nr:MAG TPA: hypothetical protein [Caudoviricetes sp.]
MLIYLNKKCPSTYDKGLFLISILTFLNLN